jgi:hypothetical protein
MDRFGSSVVSGGNMVGFFVVRPGLGFAQIVGEEYPRVRVRMVENGAEHTFECRSFGQFGGLLARAQLPVGNACSLAGQPGIILRVVRPPEGEQPAQYEVEMDEGATVRIASEIDLQVRKVVLPREPLQMLAELYPDDFLAAKYRSGVLDAYGWLLRQANGLQAILSSRADLRPHQVLVAGTVVLDRSRRYVLGDEVGLGKTVEASVVVFDTLAFRPEARVLVVCPDALCRQWFAELYKFGHRVFTILDLHPSPLEKLTTAGTVIVSSTLASFELADAIVAKDWDLVVIDEVHQALASPTQYALAHRLAVKAGSLLLLSAMPARRREDELLRLLALLEPERYDPSPDVNRDAFKRLHDAQSDIGERLSVLVHRISQAEVQPWPPARAASRVVSDAAVVQGTESAGEEENEALAAREDVVDAAQRLKRVEILAADEDLATQIQLLRADSAGLIEDARRIVREVVERHRISRRILRNRRAKLVEDEQLVPIARVGFVTPYPPSQVELDALSALGWLLAAGRAGGMPEAALLALGRVVHHAATLPHTLVPLLQKVLLSAVVAPVLRQQDALRRKQFPEIDLPVDALVPVFWSEFERTYLSGPAWTKANQQRMERLSRGWISVENPPQAAAQLEPIRAALGFPAFAKSAGPLPPPDPAKKSEPVSPAPTKKEDQAAHDLQVLLNDLRNWVRGETLTSDDEPRLLLADFVRNSIPWLEQTTAPRSEFRRRLWDEEVRRSDDPSAGTDDDGDDAARRRPSKVKAFVRIEGMSSRVATQHFFIDFPRNEETRELIEALAKFEHHGKSWNFDGAEVHKRVIARWRRKHQQRVIDSLKPAGGDAAKVDAAQAVHAAGQFLAAAATIRNRRTLPDDPAAAVAMTLEETRSDSTFDALTPSGRSMVAVLTGLRAADLREFVLDELDIPQGLTGGRGVINPVPLLRAVRDFAAKGRIAVLASGYEAGFWGTRFGAVRYVRGLDGFTAACQSERAAIVEQAREAEKVIRDAGYGGADIGKAVADFAKDLQTMVTAVREGRVTPGSTSRFDNFVARDSLISRPAKWTAAISAGTALSTAGDDGAGVSAVLAFDPQNLKQTNDEMAMVADYLQVLHEELTEREKEATGGGPGVEKSAADLTRTLHKIGSLASEEKR